MSPTQTAPPSTNVEVAPFIRRAVGDPGRPTASLPASASLDHLPGESGIVAGLTNMYGVLREGAVHFRRQVDRYGKVYRHAFGPMPLVCVADPDLVNEIGRNTDRIWSAALGWRLLLDGLDARPTMDSPALLDFEAHKDIRKLYQAGFSMTAMNGYLDAAAPLFDAEIERWLSRGRVSLKAEARRLFATVANRVFLGVTDPEETALLDQAMADFWRGPFALTKSTWLSPTWRRAVRAHRRLAKSLTAMVEERRRGEGKDLFSYACRQAPEIGWVDDAALVSSFAGLLAAAFDTTSMAVTSMGYALAVHRDEQERLREEALAMSASDLDAEGMRKLERCDRAWKETLRRYSVAANLPRRPLRDTELGGFHIPAGAMVVAMISPLHLDPAIWTDPMRFDPDRFSPERAEDKKHRGAFLPFGLGAHACIGAQLSTFEAKAFFHSLLRRARFRLETPYEARHVHTPLGCVSGAVDLVLEPL